MTRTRAEVLAAIGQVQAIVDFINEYESHDFVPKKLLDGDRVLYQFNQVAITMADLRSVRDLHLALTRELENFPDQPDTAT